MVLVTCNADCDSKQKGFCRSAQIDIDSSGQCASQHVDKSSQATLKV